MTDNELCKYTHTICDDFVFSILTIGGGGVWGEPSDKDSFMEGYSKADKIHCRRTAILARKCVSRENV